MAAAVSCALVLSACTSGDADSTTLDPSAAPTTQPQPALSEPIALVLEDSMEVLGDWALSPDRTSVAFEVSDELRVAGSDGNVVTIGRITSDAYPIFLNETELVVETVTNRNATLRYAATDGDGFTRIVRSSVDIIFAGATESEIIFVETSDEISAVYAWDIATEETRTILELEHEDGGIAEAKVIGEYIVFELREGEDRWLRSTVIADGRTTDLPRHPPGLGLQIIGESPIKNTVVLTEQGRNGTFIYTINLDNPDEVIDLVSQAQVTAQNYTGATLQFVDPAAGRRLLDLATGHISDVPPEQNPRTDVRVVGLVEDTGRVAGGLPNGNWLVTGFSVGGRTYESVWNRSEDFGGGQIVTEATVRALFEYNPVTEQLWQVSGPPTFALSSTVSGSGDSPSWVLAAVAMDGFIVYSTGFSGAAYDIQHNLYISPIPSALGG